ncbi:nucleoside-triphosphatase [Lachnospiraceae bacterium LCP25S3_G4]
MGKMLFLEGPSGIGKSTIILDAARESRLAGAGFFSQRLNDEDGCTKAFQMVAYQEVKQSIAHYIGSEKDIFFQYPGTTHSEIHMEVFDHIRTIVGTYQNADFLLLDEIGGMELKSIIFTAYLYELLGSGIPCIGVIKSQFNHQHMGKRIQETRMSREQYLILRKRLVHQYGAQIVYMETTERQLAQQRIMEFFKEIKNPTRNHPF